MTGTAFDPTRAAAGEPVQFCQTGGTWVDVHYVGVAPVHGGQHVIQFPDGKLLITGALRMKPPVQWALVFNDEATLRRMERALVATGFPPAWRVAEWPGDAA